MKVHQVKPEDVAGWLIRNNEERVKRVVKAIQDTVAMRGPAIAQEVINAMRPPPVDRGGYRRGFRAVMRDHGAALINSTPYADVIERGRRPGRFPPVDLIAKWVRRKRLATTPAKVRGVAFLVARKIARRGIPGRYVMAQVEKQLTPLVEQAARAAVKGGSES